MASAAAVSHLPAPDQARAVGRLIGCVPAPAAIDEALRQLSAAMGAESVAITSYASDTFLSGQLITVDVALPGGRESLAGSGGTTESALRNLGSAWAAGR